MIEKKEIWNLFDKLRPIIIEKLLNPAVSVSPRGHTFFYDGIRYDDNCCVSDVAQLVVPLNDEMAEVLSPDELFTAHQSEYHNVWYVYPDSVITLLPEGWQQSIIISLKTHKLHNYQLCISFICYGADSVAAHGEILTSGIIAQIAQSIRSAKFPGKATAVFKTCLDSVVAKTEELERRNREIRLFTETDLNDYESVMKFVDFLHDKNVLKSKGRGLELFTYERVVCLIDTVSKRVCVLVGRDGKAQFCRFEDFSDDLLRMIRCENRDWNFGVYDLSVGNFNSKGQAFVTWVISPYYYCPMDEDGFGEEEEFEVAVTCHINTKGCLADSPVWKPYKGPRR